MIQIQPQERVEGRMELAGRLFIICGFVGSLLWSVFTAKIGWNNTLSDQHGFRQTQTAITSYYMQRGGPFLCYETPVLGRPWSIPFEFPLYQWTVASVSGLFHTPLNQTGRFVSEVFFYLSLLTTWFWLSEINVRSVHRLIFISLILVSPLYVFWSRTFMIESTALFFCIAYLFFVCHYARAQSLTALLLGAASGVLGALVKFTTIPAFMTVAASFYFHIRRTQNETPRMIISRGSAPLLFFVLLPLLATFEWTHYADQVKSLNVVADTGLTSKALREWNFGWLSQRFSWSAWKVFLEETIPDIAGNNLIMLLPIIAIWFARHRMFVFVVSLCGFLSVFLIFMNLHVVHNYYPYANGVFLIMASAWGIVGLMEQNKIHYLLGMALFLLMLFVSMQGYYDRYYKIQKTNCTDLRDIADVIKQATPSNEIILVFGEDWSSELPYYSERRALMWPKWMSSDFDTIEMKEVFSRLGDTHIGALVICQKWRNHSRLTKRAPEVLKFNTKPKYENHICSLYAP